MSVPPPPPPRPCKSSKVYQDPNTRHNDTPVISNLSCGGGTNASSEYNPLQVSNQDQKPTVAMLVSMSRPPSIPSHPGPPSSHTPYLPTQASLQLEFNSSSHQIRPRIASGSHHNAQQLPSLRTLLEPELLDKKSSSALSQPFAAQATYTSSSRYGSASPTLKRRHEADGEFQGHPEHNAITSQTSYHQRPLLSTPHSNLQSTTALTSGSAFPARSLEPQRHNNHVHHDTRHSDYRPSSSTMEPMGPVSTYVAHDEFEGVDRPVRRRLDGSSRAPIRSSRCIGQRDILGEGVCYVYEDGTYCRAIIDGEPVNPSWGITKAGKPRKRLAQACLTCREKKIKCEPGFPKCHQCTKSQRECRGVLNQAGADNASGETSPSTSTVMYNKRPSLEDSNHTAISRKPKTSGEFKESSTRFDSWNFGSSLRPRSFRSHPNTSSIDMSVQSVDSDCSGSMNEQGVEYSLYTNNQDRLALQWEQDPFETDGRLTMHLLDLYFLHAGRATYRILPRGPFLAWVESNRSKGQDSLMLLYSLLAVGSLYSADPDNRALGKRFACVASYAAERRFGKFSLQLCQTRLMLALVCFIQGKPQEAWDFCGAALRAIVALKMNTEEGVKELTDGTRELSFDFDQSTLEECCRRTFWTGFLMERHNCFIGATPFVISLEDTFARLPCRDSMYEASTPCESPFFGEVLLNEQGSPGALFLGDMAYSCLIAGIWGNVLTFTERAARRPERGYQTHYEQFYIRTYEDLAMWCSMLPSSLRYDSQNPDNSVTEGDTGTIMTIHALYHATIIRLNRHVRTHAIPADKLRHNIKEAVRNASGVLSMVHSLAATNRQRRLSNPTSEFVYSTPFPGYALLMSIDVLTSVGTLATLPDLIATITTATMPSMEELVDFWVSVRLQQKKMACRLRQLTDLAGKERGDVCNGSHGPYWKLEESLESAFGNDDALYKVDRQLLFDVIDQLAGH